MTDIPKSDRIPKTLLDGNSGSDDDGWRIGMADKQQDKRRKRAEALAEQGLTQAAIAERLGVSTRTIERWASDDGWGAKRRVEKVIEIGDRRSTRDAATEAPSPRVRRQISEIEIIEIAISDLSTVLSCGNTDSRSLGGIASALVRLLEYKRKINPPTVAALAEQVIALGISPSEFARELREQWQLRA